MNYLNPIILQMMFKILLAAILGAIIGIERTHRRKAAGIRTFMLVALGSALFSLLSVSGFSAAGAGVNFDPSRVASQIIVGVGFLGAGIIFVKNNKIEGLTTAAGVWVSAAIGMAVGLGFYLLAVYATFLVVLVLWLLRILEPKVPRIETNNNEENN